MGLQEVLHNFSLKRDASTLVSLQSVEPVKIITAYEAVKVLLGGAELISLPAQFDSAYWVALARQTHVNNTWENLRLKDLKHISFCLWCKSDVLANDMSFLKAFYGQCIKHHKKSICKAWVWSYLINYKQEDEATYNVGIHIKQFVEHWDWPWLDRHKEFGLFHSSAAKDMGEFILISPRVACDLMAERGLTDRSLQQGGLALACFENALRLYIDIANRTAPHDVINFIDKLKNWACLGTSEFVYELAKTRFMESLLLPWISIEPPEDVKKKTQNLLIDMFGDPRLNSHKWHIDESAKSVIFRWLVKSSLEQFLKVVDELADDYQWEYRRAFWMGYYNKGVISDAWVAFARNGELEVKRLAQQHSEDSWLSFGVLENYTNKDHAVLILKLGDITIADFSHMGKCRIWKTASLDAPKLGQKSYTRKSLAMNFSDEFAHNSSVSFAWQRKIAEKIRQMTGINLAEQDYTP